MALGNGYLGMRGCPEESGPSAENATLINGFYETRPIVLLMAATPRDRLDQRRITSQFLALLPQSGQQQLGSNATMPVIDGGRQFDSAGTWLV
jgi:hypothetical protein